VTRTLAQVVDVHPFDDGVVDTDLRDPDDAHALALFDTRDRSEGRDRGVVRCRGRHGRGRRGRAGLGRLASCLLELLLEVVLGSGLVDAGAPQLVGDEQQEEQSEGDEDPPDRPEHPAHGRRG
jgi:hypothetical protein